MNSETPNHFHWVLTGCTVPAQWHSVSRWSQYAPQSMYPHQYLLVWLEDKEACFICKHYSCMHNNVDGIQILSLMNISVTQHLVRLVCPFQIFMALNDTCAKLTRVHVRSTFISFASTPQREHVSIVTRWPTVQFFKPCLNPRHLCRKFC